VTIKRISLGEDLYLKRDIMLLADIFGDTKTLRYVQQRTIKGTK